MTCLPTTSQALNRIRSGTGQVTDDPDVVGPLEKGLAILGLFDSEHREWTLRELFLSAALPRMTAYRMIRTMQSARYVVRDPVTNRYRLGPALLATTYLAEGHAEFVEIAKPHLRELVDKTGESAALAMEVDGAAVYVDSIDGLRPFRREVAVGRIIDDTANANGKVFAAFKTAAERATLLAQPHPQITPNTITDCRRLAAELERVVREGVAFDIEERSVGTCAVAAPVRGRSGNVIATVCVVVPAGRFGPTERGRCAQAVKATAGSFSASVGHSRRNRAPLTDGDGHPRTGQAVGT